MMARKARVCALVCALAFASYGAEPAPPEEGLSVLFIGNSLTYSNRLPKMLEGLLEAGVSAAATVEAVAFPNFGLQEHWVRGKTRKKLAGGDWDVVIFQQGPSATEGRPSLLEYSRLFSGEIVRLGARPALFMVWPARARSFDFDGVADSYRTAAELNDALLLPAGDAWREAWKRDPDLALYDRDEFHPSQLGSYLAALVMFEVLTDRDSCEVAGLSRHAPRKPLLTPELSQLLCEAASAARASQGRIARE